MSLKNRNRLCTTISKDNNKLLKELTINSRIPISKLIDEAIELLIECHKNKADK